MRRGGAGIDLSRFKVTSRDRASTTLRSDDGHELKVAHAALSPKMRSDLSKLPIHKAGVGDNSDAVVEDDDTPPPTNEAPATAPAADEGDEDDDDDETGSDIPTASASAPAPAATPAAGAAPPEQNAAALPPAAASPAAPSAAAAPPAVGISDELKAQSDLFGNDLVKGHVKPETYQSMFAKQDTLGKVGTLFGLLLSGAGSGLAHQQNAVLGMMKDTLDRDFEAQKASVAGAQNFVKLNLEHQLNQAQIQRYAMENGLTAAQITQIPYQNLLTAAQTEAAKAATKAHLAAAGASSVESKIKADALARMQMNRTALHELTTKLSSLPPGSPERAAAEQQLALLNTAVQNENYDIADRAQAAAALGSLAYGPQAAEQGDEAGFQRSQTTLRLSGGEKIAEDRAARHFPGIPGLASIPLTTGDREQINAGITFQDQLKRFTDWTKAHSGSLSPSQRNEGEALAAQLQGAYRTASHGGVYKEGEQGFISSVIDSEPTKFFNSVRVLPKLEAVQKESSAQLDQRLKSQGFAKGYEPKAEAGGPAGGNVAGIPAEGTTAVQKSTGRPIVVKGGRWVYQGGTPTGGIANQPHERANIQPTTFFGGP